MEASQWLHAICHLDECDLAAVGAVPWRYGLVGKNDGKP